MDRKTFETVIAGLWARLGIAEPVFGPDPEVILLVDGFEIVLRHGEDGRVLVIEAQAGTLTSRPGFERIELEKLLKTNLMLSAVRNTIAVLDADERSDTPRILIRAFYRYQQNALEKLTDLVSDVVSSSETLQQVLAALPGAGKGLSASGDMFPSREEELVVLRL